MIYSAVLSIKTRVHKWRLVDPLPFDTQVPNRLAHNRLGFMRLSQQKLLTSSFSGVFACAFEFNALLKRPNGLFAAPGIESSLPNFRMEGEPVTLIDSALIGSKRFIRRIKSSIFWLKDKIYRPSSGKNLKIKETFPKKRGSGAFFKIRFPFSSTFDALQEYSRNTIRRCPMREIFS